MECGTPDGPRQCWAPGDHEHDHQMCRDTQVEAAIEEALKYAPEHLRDAARGAIGELISEARDSGRMIGGYAPLYDCQKCGHHLVFSRVANALIHAMPMAPGIPPHAATPMRGIQLPLSEAVKNILSQDGPARAVESGADPADVVAAKLLEVARDDRDDAISSRVCNEFCDHPQGPGPTVPPTAPDDLPEPS